MPENNITINNHGNGTTTRHIARVPVVPPVQPIVANDDSHDPSNSFRTESLELASYLLARGHRLVGTDREGSLVIFVFPGDAVDDTASFFEGSYPMPPVKIFEAHRTLRMMISTMRGRAGAR